MFDAIEAIDKLLLDFDNAKNEIKNLTDAAKIKKELMDLLESTSQRMLNLADKVKRS